MFFARCLVFFRMRKNALKMSRKPHHFSIHNILEKLKHSEQMPRLCIAVSVCTVNMRKRKCRMARKPRGIVCNLQRCVYLRLDFSARCLRIPAFIMADAEP